MALVPAQQQLVLLVLLHLAFETSSFASKRLREVYRKKGYHIGLHLRHHLRHCSHVHAALHAALRHHLLHLKRRVNQ